MARCVIVEVRMAVTVINRESFLEKFNGGNIDLFGFKESQGGVLRHRPCRGARRRFANMLWTKECRD